MRTFRVHHKRSVDTLRLAKPEGKPILVTGSHRSGTTWLANMLALADGTLLAHEPFNIEPWAYSLGGVAKHWFAYVPGLPRDAVLEALDAFLQRRTRKAFLKPQPQYWLPPLRRGRLMIKDPIAALSSDWLAHNYDLEVVVLVRHPVAFAASLKRLGWKHPFGHFLEQDDLMREHLEPYRDEIASKPQDVVEQAALLWKCLYGVLFTYLGRNPDWHLRKHETLCGDPVDGLKGLYDSLGLRWTKRVEDGVLKHTQGGNPARHGPPTAARQRRERLPMEEHTHHEGGGPGARGDPPGTGPLLPGRAPGRAVARAPPKKHFFYNKHDGSRPPLLE